MRPYQYLILYDTIICSAISKPKNVANNIYQPNTGGKQVGTYLVWEKSQSITKPTKNMTKQERLCGYSPSSSMAAVCAGCP